MIALASIPFAVISSPMSLLPGLYGNFRRVLSSSLGIRALDAPNRKKNSGRPDDDMRHMQHAMRYCAMQCTLADNETYLGIHKPLPITNT